MFKSVLKSIFSIISAAGFTKKKHKHDSAVRIKIIILRAVVQSSLRGRLKGKGKGILGARETREAREEGGKETPAGRPLYFSRKTSSFLTSTRRMLKS